MKIFSLIASVLASDSKWDGVALDNTCGMTISGDSFVNKTCEITGSSIEWIFAGNGAFINGPNTFTGFDGVSGNVNVVVFFEQKEDEKGNMDNSTCWNAAVSCADSGADFDGPYFMENTNDHRNADGNYNIQIANVKPDDVLIIYLTDNNGGAFAVQNITTPFGEVEATEDNWGNQYSDDGAFTINVGKGPFGQLFQVSVTKQPGVPEDTVLSFWMSSVNS